MAQMVLEEVTETKTRLMPKYRVLIHNDPLTEMLFVIAVLAIVWKVEREKAIEIMLTAHHTGLALVTVEPLEHAEFHVDQAHSLARARKYPLTFTYEPEG